MKLLDTERLGPITHRTYLHQGDDGRDRFTVTTTQDVDSIIAANRREYNDAPSRFGSGSGFHRVARIPVTVIEEACRVYQIKYRELILGKTDKAKRVWRTLLNAPELRAFRTRPGRVDVGRHG